MSWNNLSMTDRAAYIKLGLDSGITDLNTIRNIYNKYADGGHKENKVLSTGNSYADAILGFAPIIGSAMEIEDAVREPSLRNIGSAAVSVGTDLLGLSLLRGGIKAYRLAKAANKAAKKFSAISSEKDVSKAYKILRTPNLNPKKYEAARETLNNSGVNKAFREAEDANNARSSYELYEHPYIDQSLNLAGFTGGLIQDVGQFINSLDNNR